MLKTWGYANLFLLFPDKLIPLERSRQADQSSRRRVSEITFNFKLLIILSVVTYRCKFISGPGPYFRFFLSVGYYGIPKILVSAILCQP